MKTINHRLLLKYIPLFFLVINVVGCAKEDPPKDPALPVVTTSPLTNITLSSAVSGGDVTNSGTDSVTERGICYNTLENPTIANTKIISGAGSGSFTATLSGLSTGNTYYIRAFATNSAGTAYGNQVVLQTSSNGLLAKTIDSLDIQDYTTYEYNVNKKLIKVHQNRGFGTPNKGFTDSLIYDNNNILIRSLYSIGEVLKTSSPYGSTTYNNGADNLPVTSNYYSGNTELITSSTYTFDGTGKLIAIIQRNDMNHIGYSRTFSTRFEYDANSNLSKIFYKDPSYPEYLYAELTNYDNADNPFYGMSWSWDHDFYKWNIDRLSKNNVGRILTYSSYQGGPLMPNPNGATIYNYEYNLDGKVSKRRVSIEGSTIIAPKTSYFIYQY